MVPCVQKLEHFYFIFFVVYDLYFDTASGLFALELHHTLEQLFTVMPCHVMVCFMCHYSPLGFKLPNVQCTLVEH